MLAALVPISAADLGFTKVSNSAYKRLSRGNSESMQELSYYFFILKFGAWMIVKTVGLHMTSKKDMVITLQHSDLLPLQKVYT